MSEAQFTKLAYAPARLDGILEKLCNGNAEALVFCKQFLALCHKVDDLIDEEWVTAQDTIATFTACVSLFSINPFYTNYRASLYPLVMVALSRYGCSVAWEKDADVAKMRMSDHLRSDGIAVLEGVALICGGDAMLAEMTPQLWEDSWREHHDEEGNRR